MKEEKRLGDNLITSKLYLNWCIFTFTMMLFIFVQSLDIINKLLHIFEIFVIRVENN